MEKRDEAIDEICKCYDISNEGRAEVKEFVYWGLAEGFSPNSVKSGFNHGVEHHRMFFGSEPKHTLPSIKEEAKRWMLARIPKERENWGNKLDDFMEKNTPYVNELLELPKEKLVRRMCSTIISHKEDFEAFKIVLNKYKWRAKRNETNGLGATKKMMQQQTLKMA